MSMILPVVLSVMLLTDPSEVVDLEAARAVSEDADRVELGEGGEKSSERREARITSVTSDFDRRAGVVMFEGGVTVRYSDDYVMCSDRLFMFLSGSNEMSRVVAIGNVAITNETRVGYCSMATYRRRKHEIEMFGDGRGSLARLTDAGEGGGQLEGGRIRFWLDSEQVEVEESRLSMEKEGNAKIL